MKEQQTRVLFPIATKLLIIISVLFLASLGAVILMVSRLSSQNAQKTAEANNFTVNQRAATQTEESIKSVQAAVLFYLEMMDRFDVTAGHDIEIEDYFFNHNRNIAAIGTQRSLGQGGVFIPNMQLLNANNISVSAVERYILSGFTVHENELRLFNASPVFNTSMITAAFPRQGRDGNEIITVLFVPNDLFDSFSTGTNTSFLINSYGDLLLHPDIHMVLGGANFSSMPIVEIMRQQGDIRRQISFTDGTAEYFGAYSRLAGIDAAVITIIPHDIVFEAVQGITRQNMYLALAVLFLTIILIWFFAKTISSPVRILVDAALRIEEGYFETHLVPQTRDEIGLLTESFDKMTKALNIFGRFTNKNIAVRAMKGEIKPGGQLKHATIFFSDIRGFTPKSENFAKAFGDDASNRIISWLNNYYTHMINCVEKTGGFVDKFIGDSVMAHWGTVSTAGNPAADAYNCIKTALLMREAILKENSERLANDPGNPKIHIGCGINTGMVTAGQLGSEQRMEYTVIGDAVNLARRIEELNKSFGTDILISEDTWKLAGDKFITEELASVMIRGKEEPVRIFAVINFKDSGGPQTLEQVRTLLGLKTSDANKLIIDEEKKKREAHNRKQEKWGWEQKQKPSVIAPTGSSTEPEISMTSFGSSAVVEGLHGNLVPVFFSWSKYNFNAGTHVIVEVAVDQDFNNVIEERDVISSISVSIPLEAGQYWWRVYPANAGSREPACAVYPCGDLKVSTNAKERIQINKN